VGCFHWKLPNQTAAAMVIKSPIATSFESNRSKMVAHVFVAHLQQESRLKRTPCFRDSSYTKQLRIFLTGIRKSKAETLPTQVKLENLT
jgi:hypothetical protein